MKLNLIPLIVVCLFSASCADPKYLSNASQIQDIDYPETKILGDWASMNVSPLQTNLDAKEVMTFFEFKTGGTGTTAQNTQNKATGTSMTIEAKFKWKYLGKNTWEIYLPASDEYTVKESNGMEIGYRGPRTTKVRYHNDELYETRTKSVYVRNNIEKVKQLKNRRRSMPVPIQMTMPGTTSAAYGMGSASAQNPYNTMYGPVNPNNMSAAELREIQMEYLRMNQRMLESMQNQ